MCIKVLCASRCSVNATDHQIDKVYLRMSHRYIFISISMVCPRMCKLLAELHTFDLVTTKYKLPIVTVNYHDSYTASQGLDRGRDDVKHSIREQRHGCRDETRRFRSASSLKSLQLRVVDRGNCDSQKVGAGFDPLASVEMLRTN